MGRPRKYFTEEERKQAIKRNQNQMHVGKRMEMSCLL